MPRYNIFSAKKLTLLYNPKKKIFILRRDNCIFGRTYHTAQAAYELVRSINNESSKPHHSMEYNLERFYIAAKAKREIEKYTRGINRKRLEKRIE